MPAQEEAPDRADLAICIGVQQMLGAVVVHSLFSLLIHAFRNASRARDRRDITVPDGIPVTDAIGWFSAIFALKHSSSLLRVHPRKSAALPGTLRM